MSNEMYDFLKWMAQIVLPAMATFYFALAGIWNLPYAEQIPGTVMALDTLLGAVLRISTAQYNSKPKGEVDK